MSAFGAWEITRLLFAFFENTRLTEPIPEPTALIARFADPSVLPVTFGTTGVRAKFAETDCAELIVTTQLPAPVQAPDQPENEEPDAADADSVTRVPLV